MVPAHMFTSVHQLIHLNCVSPQILLTIHRVLAWGYALNHTALSVHRLTPDGGGPHVSAFTDRVRAVGLPLNSDGGLIKVGMVWGCQVWENDVQIHLPWI